MAETSDPDFGKPAEEGIRDQEDTNLIHFELAQVALELKITVDDELGRAKALPEEITHQQRYALEGMAASLESVVRHAGNLINAPELEDEIEPAHG